MAEAQGTRSAAAPDAIDAATLPQVFGRYLLLRRLSRGGMGEIFLAKLGEIQGFEKLVIIKKVLPNLAADGEFIKRFIDEAQVAIKLNHANIAPVFEVGRVDGEYFLAIAYIEGRDLRRTMSRLRDKGRRLPADLALYVVRELAAGLAYAHRRTDDDGRALNLVHCDISPPNVMVSFEGEVKIIDFGIAKSALRLAESNPNMGFGKFGYMAPEQLLRGGTVDKRTDLYAAGVVLYELLTGERMVVAPDGGDYRAVARAVTQGKFPPPSAKNPEIPPALDALVMKAIAVRADDRFQTGEALRDAIQAELARLSPTLSGDQLAVVMRDLFSEEISEERELVARMNEVDLSPFREELTEASVSHTVTFARAPAAPENPAPATPPPALPRPVPSSPESSIPTDTGVPRLTGAPNSRRVLQIGVLAMLVGAVGVFIALRPRPQAAPPVVTAAPAPPPAAPAPPPAAPSLVVPAPPEPPVAPPPVPPAKHAGSNRRPGHRSPSADRSPSSSSHEPAAVQARFRKVRGEYAAFKAQYGGVLEERWNAIATEITFGKTGDKYVRVDQLIDTLQREMQRVRDGK